MKNRRPPRVLAALGISVAIWAPTQAVAQPPETIEPTTFTLSGVCEFPVQFDVQGKAATRVLPDGGVLQLSPTLTVTVTNVVSGETMDLKIPGPIRRPTTGEVIYTGPSLVIRGEQYGDDINGLAYVTGRWVFDPNAPEGSRLTGVGRYTDVCASLA